ncbi:hypothetical protein BHM03_00053358 [Ensete ventricosum]|nr:hypothetical protein BHM03_00053358 [Ensete ventricosum]
MNYLQAAISESLRLYPLVSLVPRSYSEEELPDGVGANVQRVCHGITPSTKGGKGSCPRCTTRCPPSANMIRDILVNRTLVRLVGAQGIVRFGHTRMILPDEVGAKDELPPGSDIRVATIVPVGAAGAKGLFEGGGAVGRDDLIITPSKGGKGLFPRCLAREYWSTEVHGSGPSF